MPSKSGYYFTNYKSSQATTELKDYKKTSCYFSFKCNI